VCQSGLPGQGGAPAPESPRRLLGWLPYEESGWILCAVPTVGANPGAWDTSATTRQGVRPSARIGHRPYVTIVPADGVWDDEKARYRMHRESPFCQSGAGGTGQLGCRCSGGIRAAGKTRTCSGRPNLRTGSRFSTSVKTSRNQIVHSPDCSHARSTHHPHRCGPARSSACPRARHGHRPSRGPPRPSSGQGHHPGPVVCRQAFPRTSGFRESRQRDTGARSGARSRRRGSRQHGHPDGSARAFARSAARRASRRGW